MRISDWSSDVCSSDLSVLAIGDVVMPEHGLGIAGGYDDSYHLTPARLVRQVVQLGYRGDVVHYVGMRHYMRLEAAAGAFHASLAGGALHAPCAGWQGREGSRGGRSGLRSVGRGGRQ